MEIYPVNHGTKRADKNRFCGPAAVSAVTKMTTGEAARLLRNVSRKPKICGVSTHHLVRALALCNIIARRQIVKPIKPVVLRGKTTTQPTLAKWFSDSVKLRSSGRVFLVVAGHHFQIVSGRRFVCAQTEQIVSITDKKVHRRARVEDVFELVVTDGDKIAIPKSSRPDKPVSKADPHYLKFRRLAKERGWTYRIYKECDSHYLEIKPTPEWPEGLDTMHYCWSETMGRVEHCLEHPEDVVDGSYSE